jgi:ubiquinone/menaquinone biosynthesis C-methylase UbiE
MIDEARARFGLAHFTALPSDWRKLPYADASFDAVVASSVFEYVDDVSTVLHELARVLASGGVLLFTVPDPAHPVRRLERVAAWVARRRLHGWPRARWTKLERYVDYLRLSKTRLSRTEWARLASGAGLADSSRSASAEPLMLLTLRKP